jgi:ankyrin repeat protein
MKHFNIFLLFTISIFSLQSCLNSSPDSNEFKKTLAELEDEKSNNFGEITEVSNNQLTKASKDKNSKRLCDLLYRLPDNKNRKETYTIIDSITPLLWEDIDPNCACSESTSYTRLGAKIPILKHFMRNKTRRGADRISSPMHIVSKKGSDSIAQLLIAKGFNILSLDSDSNKVLDYGITQFKTRTLETLIKHGASTEGICLCGITSLNKIEELTRIGFDSSGVDVSGGLGTFLKDDNLKEYFKFNPDVSKCVPNLFFASKSNDAVLKKFIKHGLRPFVRTGSGFDKYVAFKLTEEDMKDETLVLLMNNVKKENLHLINEPDKDKYLLHEAIKSGHPKMVAKLLELGADPDIINENGENAIDLADKHPDILKMLNER